MYGSRVLTANLIVLATVFSSSAIFAETTNTAQMQPAPHKESETAKIIAEMKDEIRKLKEEVAKLKHDLTERKARAQQKHEAKVKARETKESTGMQGTQ